MVKCLNQFYIKYLISNLIKLKKYKLNNNLDCLELEKTYKKQYILSLKTFKIQIKQINYKIELYST